MAAERAKIASKTNLIVEIDLLVAEEDHLVLDERLVKLLHLLVRQRPGQVDIADLRADMRRQRLNGDGFIFHDVCSVVGDATGYAAASWDPLNARMGDDLRPASNVIPHERAEFLRARSCDVRCHLVDQIDIMGIVGNRSGLGVQAIDHRCRGARRHEQPGPGADVEVRADRIRPASEYPAPPRSALLSSPRWRAFDRSSPKAAHSEWFRASSRLVPRSGRAPRRRRPYTARAGC